MSDGLINDKIAWHKAKIIKCIEQINYHRKKLDELQAITINTNSNTISANDSKCQEELI